MRETPPKWPDKFLSWFCRKDLIEFYRGDLLELYLYRLEKDGKTQADFAFYWDVLRLLRPSNIRKNKNSIHTIMLGNYLKVGFRSLRKNWANSFINISGLALSVGCALTTFLFADFLFNLNTIHSQLDKIHQVVSHIEDNNKPAIYGPSPLILSEKLQSHSEIENSVRVQYLRGNVKFDKNVFRELILFTESSYFDVFDFDLLSLFIALKILYFVCIIF